MADNTIIQQGRFASTGLNTTITLRSDVDWMTVYNYTRLAAGGAGTVAQAYWQRGMAAATGIVYNKLAADDSLQPQATTAGFTLVDTSGDPNGPLNNTVTRINGHAVTLASTAGIANGDVVRILHVTGARQLGGIDFTIDTVVANTSFNLTHINVVDSGIQVAQTLRRIAFDPIYYPRRRTISAITQAAQAVITMTVTHAYSVGDEVRISVPFRNGMPEMDGLLGTVTAINATPNSITVDIDSTAFTAFAFPLDAITEFTPAQVIPVGVTAGGTPANDATRNTGLIGLQLGTDIVGTAADVIYWVAGKSFSITNN